MPPLAAIRLVSDFRSVSVSDGGISASGPSNFLYEQKVTKNSPRGKPLGDPHFQALARLCVRRTNSPSAVTVRCQIHLALVRLPAYERREKQTCRSVPPNWFAVHGAVVTGGQHQRGCSIAAQTAPNFVGGFGGQISESDKARAGRRTDGRWFVVGENTC